MSGQKVYDTDGACVGNWDRTNGCIEVDCGSDMRVDTDGTVTDADGNYVGRINSSGRLS